MANKWRTTVSESNALMVKHGVDPFEPQTEVIVRRWTGIDKTVVDTLIATLKSATTVTDPKADNQTYGGVWTVKSVDSEVNESGNLAGSASIVQVLNKWRTTLEENEALLVKYGVDPFEPQTTILVRKWTGIDRLVADTLIVAAAATTTVTNPQADRQVYTGVWTVKSIEQEQGASNTTGSVTIVQVLNKWRTTLSENQALFERYSINPSDILTETLVRKWTGINRLNLATILATLKAVTAVVNPQADGLTYTGNWTVDSVIPRPEGGGDTNGSVTIVQTLKSGVYTKPNPDNMTIVRSRAYPFEQNENSWMYYERYKSEVTTKWSNIASVNIIDGYDRLREIKSTADYVINRYDDLYTIVFVKNSGQYWGYYRTAGTYLTPFLSSNLGVWHVNSLVLIANPIIRECWYEKNNDGTYNLFRTLETTETTAIMRTRALQYAGMTLISGSPILDDTVLTITGLENETEVVYKNARFRIGSDTYRVLGDSTAVGGTVTVDVNPAVTQATEDACDDNANNVQCFWDAL